MHLLLTGATGALGGYLLRELARIDAKVSAWSGSRPAELFGVAVRPVDLARPDAVAGAFRALRPDVVLHVGALASIGACWQNPQQAQAINVGGSTLLAELTAEAGARLLLVSTDLVFDGTRGWYTEQDPPAPLSVYGRSKADAERAVLGYPRTAVARVSLLFGPTLTSRGSFFDQLVSTLRAGQTVICFADEWRTPLALATAAQALVGLARSDFEGLLHLGGAERLSRLEMGLRLATYLGVDTNLVLAAGREDLVSPERRPRDTSLDSTHWRVQFGSGNWPSWEESLAEMFTGRQEA